MRIGICGAQRTGKTTLALALAERLGYEFLETNVAKFLEERRLEVASSLETQEKIRKYLKKQFKEYKRIDFVSDRTPLDILAYSSYIESRNLRLYGYDSEHTLKCFKNLQSYFDVVFLVQPGIEIPEEERNLKYKASCDSSFVNSINESLKYMFGRISIRGVAMICIPESIIDLDERIEFVIKELENV
jgi:predicted ATPase